MNDFLQRLRERKLVQWALAYVAAAFALIQVIDIVAQRFGWPELVVRLAIIILAIGFFVTLVIAWYHGERGAQRVTGTELLILALLLSIGGVVAWRLAPAPKAPIAATADAAAEAAPGKSIAVLPFENLSDDKGNAYFGDGITEEILDALAQISNLKVAARSSAFRFRSGGQDLRKVGQVLGVANVLEGSVQKAGDQVRINVQLVDAQSGLQLWSQKYDRKLDNVFVVEDDISRAIATQLRVQLTGGGGQPLVSGGTSNTMAHELYLRGLPLIAARGPGLRDALADFKQAVTLDPKYAQAWGALAETEMLLPGYRLDTIEDAMPSAEAAAQQALAIDSDTALAYVARGTVRLYRSQWAQADQDFRHALLLAPGDAETVNQYGQFLSMAGDLEPSLREIELARQLDPLAPINDVVHIGILEGMRRFDEAVTQTQSLIAAHPDFYPTRLIATLVFMDTGRYQDLEVQLRAIAAMFGVDPEAKALLARGMADPKQRLAALNSLETSPANADLRDDPMWHAYYLMALGDKEHAFDQLEIYSVRHNSVFVVLVWDKQFDPVRNDLRFQALLVKLGLPYVAPQATP